VGLTWILLWWRLTKVIEIYGPESSVRHGGAACGRGSAKAGGIAAYVDAEHALTPPTLLHWELILQICWFPNPILVNPLWKLLINSFALPLTSW